MPERRHTAAGEPELTCVRCKKRITDGTGYVRDDGGSAHIRCPGRRNGTPDSVLDALRCPSCGKPAWEDGYLVVDGRPWHLGCVPGLRDHSLDARG